MIEIAQPTSGPETLESVTHDPNDWTGAESRKSTLSEVARNSMPVIASGDESERVHTDDDDRRPLRKKCGQSHHVLMLIAAQAQQRRGLDHTCAALGLPNQ